MPVIAFCQLMRFGVFVGCILSAAYGHPASNDMPFVGLVVVPESLVRLTGRNQADFDCGKINAIDSPQVEHRFTVRNDAAAPLAVTSFEPTCHCTTAVVEKIVGQAPAPDAASVYYLLPGEELVLKLTVQLVRQPSGPFSHGVAIRVAGHEDPIARLNITGVMEVGLMVNPSELDFGQMKQGTTSSLTLTIQCDQRLLSNGALPRLEAQGVLLKIVPQAEPASANIPLRGNVLRTKTFVVTVQAKKKGELSARLTFASTPTEYSGLVPYARAMEIFSGVVIPVCGEVTGK